MFKRAVVALLMPLAVLADTLTVEMLPGEEWRGAANYFGSQMPFDASTELEIDLMASNYANQYSSLLISNRGRVIWSDRQARFFISGGVIDVASTAPIQLTQAGSTLREAFQFASRTYFPPSGRTPDELFFSAPQYNTWIELTYNQNEKDILAYAQSMLDHGLPPGVLMIDDTWQTAYGDWNFDVRRFSDPKGLVAQLHEKGFKVILWICPWVGLDTPAYRLLTSGQHPFLKKRFVPGGLYMENNTAVTDRWSNRAVVSDWWNGRSALLDFTHPRGRAWFKGELDRLVQDFGVDGFKLDGGALPRYLSLKPFDPTASTAEQANGFAKFALMYPVCEYRHAFNYGGQPVVMRLHDKNHRWDDLQAIIPDMLAGGLLGCAFMCPDMVGGGNWVAFTPGEPFEEELFVRSAAIHALCGQMQFSASPWRVLSAANQKIICDLVKLRQKFAPRFVELAKESGRTGEPMMRAMDYVFPDQGYGKIKDQFLMGNDLLVAPVVVKGAVSRTVMIPPGKWRADDGKVYVGPQSVEISVPLSRLPYFERQAD